MMLRDVMRMVAIGLIAGIAVAVGAARLVSSQLSGVGAGDPLSFALAAAVMAIVAALAGVVPARRATRVDPMAALRCE
jgi:putative ABC transport system permease protein